MRCFQARNQHFSYTIYIDQSVKKQVYVQLKHMLLDLAYLLRFKIYSVDKAHW